MTTIGKQGFDPKTTSPQPQSVPFSASFWLKTLSLAMLALSASMIGVSAQAGNAGEPHSQAYAQNYSQSTSSNDTANLARFTRQELSYNTGEAELIASVEAKAEEISNIWIKTDNPDFIGAADTYHKLKKLYPDMPAVFLYEHMLILEDINQKNNVKNDDLNNLKISLIALLQEFDKLYVGDNYSRMTASARKKVELAAGSRGASIAADTIKEELYKVRSQSMDKSIAGAMAAEKEAEAAEKEAEAAEKEAEAAKQEAEALEKEAEASRQRAEQNMKEAEASRKRTEYYKSILKQNGVD